MASAQITGSEHDFSNDGWTQNSEICVVCHAPHNNTTVAAAPLWNHATSVGPWTMYGGSDIQGTIDAAPSGVSLLCLSCHDGTVALDSFGGTTGSTFIGGGQNLGTDLSNDHPISITYDNVLDPDLVAPDAGSGVTGGTTIAADMLFAGKVECASCHDVHNAFNLTSLLKKTNTASGLCLTCHIK
jgi:predicted CXXCH cytochrome family protein